MPEVGEGDPDPEVGIAKGYRLRFKRLDVYRAAAEHFVWTVEVVQRMPNGPYEVTSQFLGASLSITGKIGEAPGREKNPGEVAQNGEEERLARIGSMLTPPSRKSRRERRGQAANEPRRAGRLGAEGAGVDRTRRSGSPRERSGRRGSNLDRGSDRE